jgi:2-polyprenyl-3-methyl-5-hydroxy-6-metoxy-1,4-benzoquinol methylase
MSDHFKSPQRALSGVSNVKKFVDPHLRKQENVNTYFQSQSSYWKDVYASNDVQGEIFRDRHEAALAWIDSLALAPGSQVLEIGCGAGFMAVALAQRGFRVQAIDSAEAMVDLSRRHAEESATTDLLSVDIGDVYSLAFENGSFDLVIALGVIPWLGRQDLAIQEMARMTGPGGHVIFTAANSLGLCKLLDPRKNPIYIALKPGVKEMLERIGLRHRSPDATTQASTTPRTRRFIDDVLATAQLVKTRTKTLGFGPFTFCGRDIFSEAVSKALHHRLQRLADRNVPIFRSTGTAYLVLARKPTSQLLVQSTSAEKPISGATNVL